MKPLDMLAAVARTCIHIISDDAHNRKSNYFSAIM